MKFKLQCIFLVHFVYIASGAIRVKVTPENNGRDRTRPFVAPKVSLVSRIIPHGYKTPPYEYDSRFNTIFVPKFRVQKRINHDTNRAELASTEFFLQPFKAFQKTDIMEPQIFPENALNVTARFISFAQFNKKNNKKLNGSHNVFRYREYEKPWHNRYSQSEKSTEMNSKESLFQTKRIRQKKQLDYYRGLDAFLRAIQRLYDNESRQHRPRSEKKIGTNLDKLSENNSKNMNDVQILEIINDILEDVQNAGNGITKQRSEYTKVDRKPLSKSIDIFHNNRKHDDYINMNNLFQALPSPNSEELRQVDPKSLIRILDNHPHNKDNLPVSKTLDSLLAETQEPNQEQQHEMKPNVKKLLFKSFKTFEINKEDLISNLLKGYLLRLLENTLNKPRQSEIVSEVDSDEPLWESIKGPIKKIQVINDFNGLLTEREKTTANLQNGAASSDELWKPQVSKNKQNRLPVKLKALLKQLKHVENASHTSRFDKSIEENAAESWPPITVPSKSANKLKILLKTMKDLKNEEQNLKSNSEEIPMQHVRVFDLANANLKNKKKKLRPQKKESFILYPTNNKKLKITVRNLADLIKVWKYIDSKKYAIQPLLRDRGTKTVELDVDNTKPVMPFNFPHFSIWNYWTYDKTLLKDDCPGDQIKVGGMCIWMPPHRK